MIRDIKYTGEVKNNYLSFDYTGMLPSMNKMMAFSNTYLGKDEITGDALSKSVTADDKNTFKHFASFMVNDIKYLIPMDNDNFDESVITEELMNHIIHGRQIAVLNYDYSLLEAESLRLAQNMHDVMEMYDDQQCSPDFMTTNIAKRRAF